MKERLIMTLRHTIRRLLAVAGIVAAALAIAPPRNAVAQGFPVYDFAGWVQAILDYARQGVQLGEATQGVLHLAKQIQQLDSTFAHHKDAAMGRLGSLSVAFQELSAADSRTLLDADFGSWRNRLSGTSGDLAAALASLDGSSLSDFLVDELDAADVITEEDWRTIFPANTIASDEMAEGWVAARTRGDRVRAADLATAEAAGRVTALLQAAKVDIDGRRGQGELSHTALQQAQVANQLTAAEMQVGVAQLEAIRVQQGALSRHETELYHRMLMVQWLQRERAAQGRATSYREAIASQRAAWRAARVGRLVKR